MNHRTLLAFLAFTLPTASVVHAVSRHDASPYVDVPVAASPATPTTAALADQRFSLMWLSGSVAHRAAIRGDASIRDTDDANLVVTHVAPGQYCITATSPSEGAVGVLQDQTGGGGGDHGSIDVSMGIGNFCNAVSGSQIAVQTWSVP